MSPFRARVGRYLRQHHLALLALFIALGGTSYAAASLPKDSVGSRQLKNNSVTTSKIKDGAVTGAKVNLATLGHVPSAITATTAHSATTANFATSAQNAAHASSADSASSAQNAVHATNADSATSASNAAHATNADQLGGSSPSAFHDSCPSGTTSAAADLCVTTMEVGTGGSGQNTWAGALRDCAALGLRLPSPAEAFLLVSTTPVDLNYWTDDFYFDGSDDFALTFTHDSNTPTGRTTQTLITNDEAVVCVTAPANL